MGYHLVAQDEYPHEPTGEPHFNESVYCNGFDHRSGVGGWMRLGNRINEGYAELSVCIYLPDGRVACQFLRPNITTNARFDAGGLSYTAGVIFFLTDSRLRYGHLIWHLFVIAGTTCHYFAVLGYAA